jgi:hypothetical protein
MPQIRYENDFQWLASHIAWAFAVSGFLWLPIVFAAFAKGGGQKSRVFWPRFAWAEVIALLSSIYFWQVPRF